METNAKQRSSFSVQCNSEFVLLSLTLHINNRTVIGQKTGRTGQKSLACCSPWCHKEPDTTEWLNNWFLFACGFSFLFFCFLFYIGVKMTNKVVLVSDVQQSDSIIHIHVSIRFQILYPIRLLQNVEQSSPGCIIGPCWSSILNTAVFTHQSQSP